MCLPFDASRNTYCLTWVSLTLDMGYLFTGAPAPAGCPCAKCCDGLHGRSMPKRSYPLPKVRGSGQEELPHVRGQGQRPRMPGCDGTGVPERSYPTAEVRSGGREEQHHVQGVVAVRVLEGQEELLHVQGQEGRL